MKNRLVYAEFGIDFKFKSTDEGLFWYYKGMLCNGVVESYTRSYSFVSRRVKIGPIIGIKFETLISGLTHGIQIEMSTK